MATARFKNTKSQAALEFLTTYGWAFLVILIMIGTLAYFGILSPSKLLPNRCNFGSEFQCLDYQIGATTFKIRMKNNIGEPMDVSSVDLSGESTTAYTCTSPAEPTPPAMPTSHGFSIEPNVKTIMNEGTGRIMLAEPMKETRNMPR